MESTIAILLGIIQGITEFLPISSSGHLVIVKDLLRIETGYDFLFNIFVHLGTLCAIIFYFYDDIRKILRGVSSGNKESYHYIFLIFLATLPVALIGLFYNDKIKSLSNIEFASYCLIFTGVILFLSKYAKEKSIKLSYLDVILIGLFQAIAILPGISRSGMTISVALFLGVNRNEASKLSFFMAIPAIIGAATLEVLKINSLDYINLMNLAIGFIISAIIGYFSISWLIKLINKLHFWKFSFYVWSLGLIILILDYYGCS